MDNFFVNVKSFDTNPIRNDIPDSEWNNSESFFVNKDKCPYVKTPSESSIESGCKQGFFMNESDVTNFIRNYSKGKSFKFSEWNEIDTYNNDEFIQDWVAHKGILWVCNSTNTNQEPNYESEFWTEILSTSTFLELSWSNFEMSE